MANRRSDPAFQSACREARRLEELAIGEAAANGDLAPRWQELLAIAALAALFTFGGWYALLPT